MTRLDALRRIVSAPRDHTDQGRIGRVQKWTEPDPIKLRRLYVYRVLSSVLRRVA